MLVETIRHLQSQQPGAAEILVVDQTPEHDNPVEQKLADWHDRGQIRWVRLPAPSITRAMNTGLQAAQHPIVLFLDDDIEPLPGLIGAHLAAFENEKTWASVGQVLQPGQEPEDIDPGPYPGEGLYQDLDFPFNGTRPRQVYNCMAGNLAVRKQRAIAVGGMDMNFQGVAHRFETEFARRLTDAGGKVMFNPAASLRHLQAPSGGTRTYGNHLTSADPAHSVGDYYMAFRLAQGSERWRYILRRFFRAVRTRFHLRHPWWIPVKWIGELRGLIKAHSLFRSGPRLIDELNKTGVTGR